MVTAERTLSRPGTADGAPGGVPEGRESREPFAQLAAFGHRLSRQRETAPLLDEAVALLRELLGAEETWVVVVDGAHSTLQAVCGADRGPPDPAGTPVGAGQPPGHARALLRTPVVHDGALVAVLFAARPAHRPFPAHAAQAARVFADHLAVALANAAHYEQLRAYAAQDGLTGLANRNEARARLDQLLADPAAGRVGVLFCDLDQFKVINDRLGHEAGDDLLCQVGARLREHLRPDDVLARFGGDEFVVVVPGVDTVDDVTEVGRRLSRTLAGAYRVAGELVRVTASLGGVLSTAGTSDASTLLRSADAAMYAAKQRGPGRVTVHDEAHAASARAHLDLRADVPFARERGELELHYQPVVAPVPTPGQVVAFEALLRWHHPRHGTVAPEVLVPLAEETGDMAAIGDWVLAQACRQLAAWRRDGGTPSLAVSVNLSADQLAEPDAAERILGIIHAAGVAPQDVWLEVTEHRFRGVEVAAQAARLHAAGVRFVLDDFGGVCSSLSFLRQLPLALLKVDLRLVTDPTGTVLDTELVRAVLAMAQALGLTTVAEGVETAAQQAALAELGCPLAQGYYWSAPAPASAAPGSRTAPLAA